MWYIGTMSIITSILTGGDNNHETTAEEVNALATDFVSEGVVGAITNTSGVAPATGAFAVNAQGTPAMAVDVSAGVAYVTATPTGGSSQLLRVKNTATDDVTIAANSTGSTRYDWVYIKIDPDNAADPAADGSDVATLVTSRSTSSSSDDGTPPTYGYPIAVVTVANGASSITNGNISDRRVATGAAMAAESWSNWTPSLTNLSGGTITLAKYKKDGRTVRFKFMYTLGGAGVSGNPSISLPVNAASDYFPNSEVWFIGGTVCIDANGTWYFASTYLNATTSFSVRTFGTNGAVTAVSSSSPFTWASGDRIVCEGKYESAI